MYGLVPAFMQARQQLNAEEAARQAQAMREQEMAMRQAQHNAAMQEANFRMEGLRRQRQSTDDLLKEYDAQDTPAPGLNLPAQRVAPEGAGFMEANGVNPAPVAAAGLARPGLSGVDRRIGRAALESGNFGDYYKLQDRQKAQTLEQWKSARFKELSAMPQEELATMAGKFTASDAPVWFNFNPENKKQPFEMKVGPGSPIPARKLTATEMVETILGAEMAGNGNFDAGIKILTDKLNTQRNLQEADRRESGVLADHNSKAYFEGRRADATDAQRAEQERHNRAIEGNDAARLRMQREQHAQTKVVPPEILKELSALEQQYVGTDDPKARAAIERQYQMTLSRAGAAVGRPMGLPTQKQAPEIKVNQDGTVIKDGVLYAPGKDGNYKPVNLGPSALDRAIQQKLAGEAAQPPAPAQAGLAPPRTPGPQLETTKTPQGATVYRYTGQGQWYPSSSAAMAALGARPQEQSEFGLDRGY